MAERGRPTTYDPDVAAEILDRLAAGETLRAICRDEGMPPRTTIYQWITDNRDNFSDRYMKAREAGALEMADAMMEIAAVGSGDVQRDRLHVDTLKWALAKAVPKLFGDKTMVSGDPEGAPIKASLAISFVRPKADAGPAD